MPFLILKFEVFFCLLALFCYARLVQIWLIKGIHHRAIRFTEWITFLMRIPNNIISVGRMFERLDKNSQEKSGKCRQKGNHFVMTIREFADHL